MPFRGEWDVKIHYLKGDIVKVPSYKYFDGHRIKNGDKYFMCMISHISCNLVYPANPDEIYWTFLSSSIKNDDDFLSFDETNASQLNLNNNIINETVNEIVSEVLKEALSEALNESFNDKYDDTFHDKYDDTFYDKYDDDFPFGLSENDETIVINIDDHYNHGTTFEQSSSDEDKQNKDKQNDDTNETQNNDKQNENKNTKEVNKQNLKDFKEQFPETDNYNDKFSRDPKRVPTFRRKIPLLISEGQMLEGFKGGREKRKSISKLNEIQQQIRVYKKQKGDLEYDLEDKIMLLDVDIQTKVFLLDKYESTVKNTRSQNSSDYAKSLAWFKTVTSIPFGKYKPFDINSNDSPDKVNVFFENVRAKLDEKIYGLDYVKDEILEFLARKITNPNGKGHILALHGIPGTGKTKILKTLADALSLPFYQINFGGMSDSSILTGHSETYIGSKPGKIVEILTNSGYMNPIIYLDEIDKISELKEREINGVLTHMLDEEQNNKFQDNYVSNVDIDLSKVLFVIAFNDLSKINNIVLDRMKIINIKIPTIDDKVIIAGKKMIPDIIETLQIKTKITINDDLIRYIILNKNNNEDGVRHMKKIFEKIFNRINYLLLIGKMDRDTDHVINKEFVDSVITVNDKENDYSKSMYL